MNALRKRPWMERRKPMHVAAPQTIEAQYAAMTAKEEIAAAFERRRQPVAAGTYGRVEVIDNAPGCIWLDINNPNVAFSADDCREAAHLLNQIAETLEAQSCA